MMEGNSMAVIEFEHVSKAYRLGASRTSLREAIPQMTRKLFSRNGSRPDDQLFWALNDVSFQVEEGEVLGIIGHNGAGKSTILKLLSKVSFPTSGQIRTQGRMAALIELGAGFHPDLSGRENIYLNGSILGLTRQEIDAQFSDIVEFAGLERFIDTPVKRYSSGMYVRLAFAVAAHVRADLLLVDEVLSVGDMAFQQRCMEKMSELRDSGTTIVFISHNLWSVEIFCERVLLLRAGQIVAEGDPPEVIGIYRRQEREDLLARANGKNGTDSGALESPDDLSEQEGEACFTKIELLDKAGQPESEFNPHDQMIVRAHYVSPKRLESPVYVMRIYRFDGLICCAVHNWTEDTSALPDVQGHGEVEACLGPLQLVPGDYTVEVLIVDYEAPLVYAISPKEPFRIKGPVRDEHAGVFSPNVEWLVR
jgi:ABC-type polysaccharide/polyol phosphate transport system ATPase subunit